MLNEAERLALDDAKHWLESSIAVCELLLLEDEALDRQPQVYLRTVQRAQASLDIVIRQALINLVTIERYLQRLPRES